jgi:uncharacterized protein YtpQ (UPF0354 family)
MTEKEFANKYLEALRKKYADVTFTLQPDLSITSTKDGKESTFYIDNVYAAYKAAPDDIEETINGYVDSDKMAFDEPQHIATANIIPLIKPIEFMRETAIEGKKLTAPIVTDKYNDHLNICYAEDTKEGFRFLTEDTFDSLNISRDSLYNLAIRNLLRILPDIETDRKDGVYKLTAGGFYDASLILVPSLWQSLSMIDGDWIIAVPKRDFLMLTGSRNKEGIKKMKKIAAEDYQTGSYPISEHLYRWNGSRFEQYSD